MHQIVINFPASFPYRSFTVYLSFTILNLVGNDIRVVLVKFIFLYRIFSCGKENVRWEFLSYMLGRKN